MFEIPEEDTDFWTKRVPHDEQRRLRCLLATLAEIWSVRETEGVNPAIRRLHRAARVEEATLRRQYYWFTGGIQKAGQNFAAGDWRILLNWTKVKSDRRQLPFGLLELWRELGELNQRNWKAAWDELQHIVSTHHGFPHGTTGTRFFAKLPGYDHWPEIEPALGHPAGMSYANLMNHVSDPYEVSLARHGRAKASEWRVPVLKTRVGLKVGQFVEFDDHDFNQKIMFQKKPQRPSGFGAIDVLTSAMVAAAFKPNLWDYAEEKRLTLTEKEFMWFVLAFLTTVGVRRDAIGTTLIVERAKAAIRDPFRSRLLALVKGLKIYDGGGEGKNNQPGKLAGFARPAFDGQERGKAKGNFRTKALIESFWNPVDNQTASLAGQMGKDRDHSPAQLHGAEQYTAGLIRQIEQTGLSQADAGLIQFPFLTFHQWRPLAQEAIMRINHAHDHKCEGWEKLGFERIQWRTDAQSPLWLEAADLTALSELDQRVIQARLNGPAGHDLTRPVRLSRWQAFQNVRHELSPVPLFHIPELVGRENALAGGEPIEVGKTIPGCFVFQCDEIDAGPLEFYARDERGYLKNGDRYVCFLNPCAPTQLIACDEKLRVVAICPRYERARLDDQSAMEKLMGQQGNYEAAARVSLNLRHDDAARRQKTRKDHNGKVFSAAAEAATSRRRNAWATAAAVPDDSTPSPDPKT